MKRHLPALALLVALFAGCSSFNTRQTDERKDPSGIYTRIETKVSAKTLFSAGTALAGWKASQTEKTQGASIQDYRGSSSEPTNLAPIFEAIARGITSGLKPVP